MVSEGNVTFWGTRSKHTKFSTCISQNVIVEQIASRPPLSAAVATFMRRAEAAARCIKPFPEWQPGDFIIAATRVRINHHSEQKLRIKKKKALPVGGEERRKFRTAATAACDSWDEIKNSNSATRRRRRQSVFFFVLFFYCRCPRFTFPGLLFIISAALRGGWGRINTTYLVLIKRSRIFLSFFFFFPPLCPVR